MRGVRLLLCVALVALPSACGLKRNLSLPKTPAPADAQTQTQPQAKPAPAAAPAATPPSPSFMIAPQTELPLAPAVLSAPTR